MTGDIEAAADAMTGGLAARVIEPVHGEAEESRGAMCLNCATALRGAYCHRCGQAAHVHRSLAAIWHDIAHSVLHFEGKLWRTLPLLAIRPGELTRRYIHGERARFVSPMALFLFSVFLMFAVFRALGGPLDVSPTTAAEDRAEAEAEFRSQRAESLAELRRLEATLQQARAAREPSTSIENDIRGIRRDMEIQQRAYQLAMRLANEEEARDAADGPEPEAKIDIKTGSQPLDDALAKAEKNPALLIYKLQANAYKFSWALIPLSVPFVWLLFFWKRRYRIYDHTVFVTYSIAFMSLAAVLLTLLRPLGLGGGLAAVAILLVPPVHMYRQLRGAYGLSRFGALWRTLLLVNFAFVAGGFFLTLLLALGVLG